MTETIVRELSSLDVSVLELLEAARAARYELIMEAARRARAPEDAAERDTSLAGILGREAVRLHKRMMQLNRFWNVSRYLGDSSLKMRKGHRVSRTYYRVTTPLLVATEPELIVDSDTNVAGTSQVVEGYTFEYWHGRYFINEPEPISLKIVHVIRDLDSGVDKRSELYEIGVEDKKHPFATLQGPVIEEYRAPALKRARAAWHAMHNRKAYGVWGEEEEKLYETIRSLERPFKEVNDDAYLFPLGLVIKANKDLSR